MTASHAHTPTDEEMQEQFEAGALVTEFSHNRTDATIAWQLWLQERDARIEAAAEQRGAAQGWDEGFYVSKNHDHVWENDPPNPYRADRMEGDE